MHQSLSGAGYLSSEFPLRVEITYTDIYGKQLRWGHGFYFREPEDPTWRIVDGDKIPSFNWYTYRSPISWNYWPTPVQPASIAFGSMPAVGTIRAWSVKSTYLPNDERHDCRSIQPDIHAETN